jgi:hypothetical protein
MNQSTLSYDEKKFVGRKPEIEKVIVALNRLLGGSPPDKRTIAFMGERGIGKSWLLKHLFYTIEKEFKNVVLFQLNLADYANNFNPVLAVLDVLTKFRACFPNLNQAADSGTPAESSRRTLEEVREQIKKQVLVVLIDHVYESDWKILAGLEDYLLGPLAIEPNTLIVLSGRGREYPWKTPELRLKAEFEYLKPLDEKDTEEQLRKQISDDIAKHAKDIFTATGGNPLGNYLLGSETDPREGLNAIINATLEVIPEADRRERIRKYLEALCVLRAFDEERIPIMLTAYELDDKRYAGWKYAESRQVRDDLVQGAFARWDESKGGFVIDDVLRKSLESYMRNVKPDVWKRLQEKALMLYQGWSTRYPRAKDFWTKEVTYHSAALQGHVSTRA